MQIIQAQELIAFSVWVVPLLVILLATIVGGKKNSAIQGIIALMAFTWATIFAALRFETGDDWQGYQLYFEAIDTNIDLFSGYLNNPHLLQFEPGYYLISYVIKEFDGSYLAVNFISVATLFLTLLFFIKRTQSHPYFIVLIFLGLPLLILFYNQVRQCIAISFVLLATLPKSNQKFFILGLFALLFQFSTVIFLLIIFFVRISHILSFKFFRIMFFTAPIIAAPIIFGNINPYDLLKYILPDFLHFKIDIYGEEETSIGLLRLVTVFYLLLIAHYLQLKMKNFPRITTLESRVLTSTLLCVLLVPYSLIVFPNSYAFFGRALNFSIIMLSISSAIIHRKSLTGELVRVNLLPIYGLGLLSVTYYIITLYVYSDIYIPYNILIS